jgi:hypothetical protein
VNGSGALGAVQSAGGEYLGVAIDPTTHFLYAVQAQNSHAQTFALNASTGAISQIAAATLQ